jgi:hypothetical protein
LLTRSACSISERSLTGLRVRENTSRDWKYRSPTIAKKWIRIRAVPKYFIFDYQLNLTAFMPDYKPLSKFYIKGEKYLFLGNGINQLSKGYSWGDLLNSIKAAASIKTERGNKTYPLFFEELSFTLNKTKPVETNIHQLKHMIAEDALKLNPNAVHQKLISANYYKHFLTTNYDYCIEKAIDGTVKSPRHQDKRTSKYSLYRYNDIGGHHIWHIHGECNNGRKLNSADSILIGFEHYADYLDKIHRILKSDTGRGLAEQIQDTRYNWVHKFFTHDIDILGFGLDFNETHLWFILNFRARLIRKKASIINTIRWIVPSFKEDDNRDKADLLKAMKVEVITVPSTNYDEFYDAFITGL